MKALPLGTEPGATEKLLTTGLVVSGAVTVKGVLTRSLASLAAPCPAVLLTSAMIQM